MTATRNRSTSVRKVKRRVPSGACREYYFRRKKGKGARCAICKSALRAVRRKGPKSSKRPERIFGGMLCPKCQSIVVVEATRIRDGAKTLEDVDIAYRRYVQGIAK
ncbi:MAG: hypothetical protein QXH30_00840 [Candidatus Bilamarchaeaceae archaeon]